jgi:hypothetical protein
MDRRRFTVSGTTILSGVGLAGCQAVNFTDGSGGTTSQQQSGKEDSVDEGVSRDDANPAGESVAHDQLEVSANQLLAASEYRLNVEDSEVHPPTAGGYWMFVNITVTHVGKERRPFPSPENARMPYQDEAAARQFFEDHDFEVRDDVYTNYHATWRRRRFTIGARSPA